MLYLRRFRVKKSFLRSHQPLKVKKRKHENSIFTRCARNPSLTFYDIEGKLELFPICTNAKGSFKWFYEGWDMRPWPGYLIVVFAYLFSTDDFSLPPPPKMWQLIPWKFVFSHRPVIVFPTDGLLTRNQEHLRVNFNLPDIIFIFIYYIIIMIFYVLIICPNYICKPENVLWKF